MNEQNKWTIAHFSTIMLQVKHRRIFQIWHLHSSLHSYRKVAPPIFKQLKCSPESFLPEMEKADWMEKSKYLFSFKSKEMYFLVFLKTPWSVLLRSLVALPTSFPFSRLFSPYTIQPAEMYLRICETPMLDFFLFLLK